MSLMNCSACGKEISSNALVCPGCGEPIKPIKPIDAKDPIHLIGLILAGLMISIIITFAAAMQSESIREWIVFTLTYGIF